VENNTGVINILKPPGITSHGVVSYVKGKLGLKAGHTGTLDPGAVGVLPILIGNSTRLLEYLYEDTKEYVFEITLGIETDSGDLYGSIITTSSNIPNRDFFVKVLNEFNGEVIQTPPMTSAIKVKGVKLYKLARNNITVEVPQRKITIHSLNLIHCLDKNKYICKVVCSKGTYIRSLCIDIGRRLGCGGVMSFLLRTRSGGFLIDDSVILEDISLNSINQLTNYIKIPDILVSKEDIFHISNGRSFAPSGEVDLRLEKRVKLIDESGRIIAIGEFDNGIIAPIKVLI
jgi:tRNA pseudouridine55 synthase